MAFKLTDPPKDERSKELWLQHVAGFIIFQDMRNYAINNIPFDTDDETKAKIINGIDDSIYGLMMVMDGVTGVLKNDNYSVTIQNKILLEKNNEVIMEINTLNSDGMCMGFHSWKEGDFGENEICSIIP